MKIVRSTVVAFFVLLTTTLSGQTAEGGVAPIAPFGDETVTATQEPAPIVPIEGEDKAASGTMSAVAILGICAFFWMCWSLHRDRWIFNDGQA